MIIEASCLCNTGRIRSNNEDNFYFNGLYMNKENNGLQEVKTLKSNTAHKPLFCVFDGMGGEEAGEVASYLAANHTEKYLLKHNNSLITDSITLETWCHYLNNSVFEESRSISTGNVGTTLVSLYFDNGVVHVSNVGDSPAFRIRKNTIEQLSVDHVEKLPPSMKHHKPRLTQNIGVDPTELAIEPSVSTHNIKKDDIYLLCSDGLTDMVSKEEILSILRSHASVKKAAESLVKQALKNGGKDNVTVLLCKIR